MRPNRQITIYLLVVLFGLVGCVANPVTGRKELRLVSEAQEIQIGKEHYLASQQMQGGAYNVDPKLTRYVQQVGQKLAAVSDRDLPYEFVVLNNSVPNAWALPGGKIAVNRGLLTEFDNEGELAAVLGHEIVHAAARHGAKGVERGMLLQGAVITTGLLARDSDYAGLILGGAQLAAGLLSQKYGRDAERESDYYGIQYMSRAGYDPRAAVSLQEVFVRLSGKRSSDWISGLFASHPPSQERVANNKRTAAALPPGGTLNRKRYQKQTAHLKRTKPAYEAHDKGRKALKDGNIKEAIALARKAIKMESREAQFHGLLGDALFSQKRYRRALPHYNRAIALQDRFFHYYVQRGVTHEKLGNAQSARKDLERSTTLLPTATANNTLGNLAAAAGNREQAVQYFRQAAGSKSPAGEQALKSLVLLDLSSRPNTYLQTRLGLNRSNMVVVQIANNTPVTVTGVQLAIRYPDAQGRLRSIKQSVSRPIPAKKSVQIRTRLGPIQDRNFLRQLQVKIIRARAVRTPDA